MIIVECVRTDRIQGGTLLDTGTVRHPQTLDPSALEKYPGNYMKFANFSVFSIHTDEEPPKNPENVPINNVHHVVTKEPNLDQQREECSAPLDLRPSGCCPVRVCHR